MAVKEESITIKPDASDAGATRTVLASARIDTLASRCITATSIKPSIWALPPSFIRLFSVPLFKHSDRNHLLQPQQLSETLRVYPRCAIQLGGAIWGEFVYKSTRRRYSHF
jgi:hypothetical protein